MRGAGLVRWTLASRNQPTVFLALMGLDLAINAAATQQQLNEHFDRMRIEPAVRKAIVPVKVAGTLGVLAGRRRSKLGALAAAAFVVYFLVAIRYHRRVDDGIIVTAPAVLYGVVAARACAADLRRS